MQEGDSQREAVAAAQHSASGTQAPPDMGRAGSQGSVDSVDSTADNPTVCMLMLCNHAPGALEASVILPATFCAGNAMPTPGSRLPHALLLLLVDADPELTGCHGRPHGGAFGSGRSRQRRRRSTLQRHTSGASSSSGTAAARACSWMCSGRRASPSSGGASTPSAPAAAATTPAASATASAKCSWTPRYVHLVLCFLFHSMSAAAEGSAFGPSARCFSSRSTTCAGPAEVTHPKTLSGRSVR